MNSFSNFLYQSVLSLLRILPVGLYLFFIRGISRVLYFFHPTARKNALQTLTIAYGDTLSDREKDHLARVSFLNLTEGIGGFFYQMGRPELSKQFFDIEGQERLDAALALGKGVVIGAAHFGPFSWMLYRFVAAGYKVNVQGRVPRCAFWSEKFRASTIPTGGVNIILTAPKHTCVRESLEALLRNEILVMPVDQNYGSAGRVFVPFFGKPAATAPGPAIFTARTGAPLLMAFAVPAPKGRFRIILEGPLPLATGGDDQADQAENIVRFTAVAERYIRQYPEQWSWMHRRWKTVLKEGEQVRGV